MLEKDYQKQIVELALGCGWKRMHIGESTKRVRRGGKFILVPDPDCQGWPDLTLVHERRKLTIFREIKTDKGRLTPPQREWLRVLEAAGNDCGVWRPRDWDSQVVPTLAP